MNMEIVQNRYGSDRVIEKITPTKLRIMGESLMVRTSDDTEGNCTMFDFEGGPCLNVGGKIRFMKSDWTITKIVPEQTDKENLCSVLLEVKL
jgi:hypothetical protein